MTEDTRTIKLPRLHPAQKQIIQTAKRFNVCCLGRRTGKTVLGLDTIITSPKCALEGYPVAWFAPAYKYLDEVFRSAKILLAPIISRTDSQQHRIELVTGGSLDFWSMDDEDPARGRKYSMAVIDEAALVKRLMDAWNLAIRPTLIDYAGSAWFLSTPKGINDFYHLYKKGDPASETHDPEWMSWKMPSSVNPYLDPAELETARKESPGLVFQQEYLAEFVDFGGTVVTRDMLQYAPAPTNEVIRPVMGVDLAISTKQTADFTSAVILGQARDGRIFVMDVNRVRATFHQVMAFIQQMHDKWNPSVIMIEETQYQAAVIQELSRTTILPVRGVRPDKDKLTRFQPVQTRYEQKLIYHAPGLPSHWEDELLSFPVGEHDDQVDAMSYAFQGLGLSQKFEFETTRSGRTARVAIERF